MPKIVKLDPRLPERAKEREKAKQIKRLKPGKNIKEYQLIANILERLEAIEKILGIDQ